MANNITAHTILNGSRNLILQFNIVADGSGDYSDFELLNVFDYTGNDPVQANNFKVLKASGRNGVGTSFQLKFGETSNNHRLFFESVQDEDFYQKWTGGLSTLLASPDMTVRITTNGFDVAGDNLTIVLWLKKKVQLDGS